MIIYLSTPSSRTTNNHLSPGRTLSLPQSGTVHNSASSRPEKEDSTKDFAVAMPYPTVVLQCREIISCFTFRFVLDTILPTNREILRVISPCLLEGAWLILVKKVHQDPKILCLHFINFVQIIRNFNSFDTNLLLQILQLQDHMRLFSKSICLPFRFQFLLWSRRNQTFALSALSFRDQREDVSSPN
jgi:hypothetical protein